MSARDQELLTLHRYFIWADRMRVQFDRVLQSGRDKNEYFELETFLYMSYWYGGAYVVIEGWKELGLSDPAINPLLESPNVGLLRKYRNGVFHYRREYFEQNRFIPLIKDGENAAFWIRDLWNGFSKFFLNCFELNREEHGHNG